MAVRGPVAWGRLLCSSRKAVVYTIMSYLLLVVSFMLATSLTVLSTESDRDIVQQISSQRMVDLVENLNYEGAKVLFANVSVSNRTFQREWLFSSDAAQGRPPIAAAVNSFFSSAANSSGYSYSSGFGPLNDSRSEVFFLRPSRAEVASNYSSMSLVVNDSELKVVRYYLGFPDLGSFSYSWYSTPSGPVPYTIMLASTSLSGTMGYGTHRLSVNSSSALLNLTFINSTVRVDYFQGQRTVLRAYFNSSQSVVFSSRYSNDNLIWGDLVFFNVSSPDSDFVKRLQVG